MSAGRGRETAGARFHGARPSQDGVLFRIWAPDARSLELVLYGGRAAGRHPLARLDGGVHETWVRDAAAGDRYAYRIDDEHELPDPASRFQPDGVHGPSQVVDPDAFAWTDARFRIRQRQEGGQDDSPNLELILADGKPYPEQGRISVAGLAVATTTGTIDVQGVFPNPNNLLRPGQFAKVRAATERLPGALVIPQRAVRAQVALPAGYEIRWGGDFENLQSASLRLALITPIVLLLIFLLLHTTFRSVRLALLIFLAVPMAASGGIFALALRGMPFSISAGVGFIALFGVAVLNGLVWVSAAEHLREQGLPLLEATQQTAVTRFRPVLMTALVASLGFLPMALSTSDGAELQRPLATVVIGGLIASTLLTSLVVPAIYPWFAPGQSLSTGGEALTG